MPTWPAELPQAPLREGLSFTHPKGLLSSPVDQGTPKVRRKTTVAYRPMTSTWLMTYAQMVRFQAFVDVDTVGGTLSFLCPDPNAGGALFQMRFDPDNFPAYMPEEPGFWLVRTSLLVLPP